MVKKIVLFLLVGIFCISLSTDTQAKEKKPWLVVYSSQTGNTREIAQAIFQVLPEGSEIYPVEEAPEPDGYENIAIGFWTKKGTADDKAAEYLQKVKNTNVFIFATMGAYADTDYAQIVLDRSEALLGENCTVLGRFICQGKLSPESLENAKKRGWTPEREKRWKDASTHPDEQDLINVQMAVRKVFK